LRGSREKTSQGKIKFTHKILSRKGFTARGPFRKGLERKRGRISDAKKGEAVEKDAFNKKARQENRKGGGKKVLTRRESGTRPR